LVQVQADKTIHLTEAGIRKALQVIRRHRIWEVFLVDKLGYRWNEVHELAEQLEHIESDDLVNRLEKFLGNPSSDPHGDPIPDRNGQLQASRAIPLLSATPGKTYRICRFAETEDSFLEYIGKLQLLPGTQFIMEDVQPYDQSCGLKAGNKSMRLSEKVARNILVESV
jgi:DtxR family transcriptional regulator, Mn-dependent transcriptional regulator